MQNLPQLYNKIEGIKGKKLVGTLVMVVLLFSAVGLIAGNFIKPVLKSNEGTPNPLNKSSVAAKQKVSYSGRIKFIDSSVYPAEGVSFVLVDAGGKEVVLLSAKDQKLSVAEGLNARVVGELTNNAKGDKKILIVEEVIINNVTN